MTHRWMDAMYHVDPYANKRAYILVRQTEPFEVEHNAYYGGLSLAKSFTYRTDYAVSMRIAAFVSVLFSLGLAFLSKGVRDVLRGCKFVKIDVLLSRQELIDRIAARNWEGRRVRLALGLACEELRERGFDPAGLDDPSKNRVLEFLTNLLSRREESGNLQYVDFSGYLRRLAAFLPIGGEITPTPDGCKISNRTIYEKIKDSLVSQGVSEGEVDQLAHIYLRVIHRARNRLGATYEYYDHGIAQDVEETLQLMGRMGDFTIEESKVILMQTRKLLDDLFQANMIGRNSSISISECDWTEVE